MRTICTAIICLLNIVPAASAEEWTRFRGPNGSGVNAGAAIPSSWSDQDYHWKIKLPGSGHSSPALWNKSIFVTSADGQGNRYLSCLNADDGRTLWQRDFAGQPQRMHEDNSQAAATPAVDRKGVYVCWGNAAEYLVIALSHEGRELWRVDLGPYKAGHGFGGSAIVHAGIVLVPNEQNGTSSLVALDGRTGKTLWKTARKSKAHYATPCIFHPSPLGGEGRGRPAEAIFASWEHGISSLDPKTGATNWEVDVFYKDHLECSIASPIVAGDLVLATCGYVGVNYETVAVRPYASSTPQTVYRISKVAPLAPTPLVKDDLLFLLNDRGILTCANVSDGKEHWRERVISDAYSSPVCAGDLLVCIARDGEAVVLACSKKFEVLGRSALGETTHATPALAHGRMYLRTMSHLMALGGQKKTTGACSRSRSASPNLPMIPARRTMMTLRQVHRTALQAYWHACR